MPNNKWVVKGAYDTVGLRYSVANVIGKCSQGSHCKPIDEINSVVELLYFTEYLLQKHSNLYGGSTKHVLIQNQMISQFMLYHDKYIDTNCFIEKELINVKDSRIFFLQSGKDYEGYNAISARQYKGNLWVHSKIIQLEDGTMITKKYNLMYGSYYFMSHNYIQSSM